MSLNVKFLKYEINSGVRVELSRVGTKENSDSDVTTRSSLVPSDSPVPGRKKTQTPPDVLPPLNFLFDSFYFNCFFFLATFFFLYVSLGCKKAT